MKLWPFGKRTETRSYESLKLGQAIAQADQRPTTGLAVTEFCAGVWARGLAAAEVSGEYAQAIDRRFLHRAGRQLLLRGELVASIATRPGDMHPTLRIPTNWNVVATTSDPTEWRYHLYDGELQATMQHDAVLHIRLNETTARPWEGVSPLVGAQASLWALAEANALTNETFRHGGSVGYSIELPGKTDPTEAEGLLDQMEKFAGFKKHGGYGMRNGIMLLAGGGKLVKHDAMKPADSDLRALRVDLQHEIATACGIPVELLTLNTGPSRREALKHFTFTTLAPVARVIEHEMHDKLSPSLRLDFSELRASDLQARSRAYSSLTQAGMTPVAAARICGFEPEAAEGATRPGQAEATERPQQ